MLTRIFNRKGNKTPIQSSTTNTFKKLASLNKFFGHVAKHHDDFDDNGSSYPHFIPIYEIILPYIFPPGLIKRKKTDVISNRKTSIDQYKENSSNNNQMKSTW